MLTKYKNSFIEVISSNGFVPNDFEVSELKEGRIFELKLTGTPFKFQIRHAPNNFHEFDCRYTKFAPNFTFSQNIPPKEYAGIKRIHNIFEHWLLTDIAIYFDELKEPNLWQQLQNKETLVSGKEITDNDLLSFSTEEKAQIRLSINEFKLLIIKEFNPSQNEISIIENRLVYLSEALDRLNRIDWKAITISSVISISITLSLDTEKGKLLFNLFKQVFSGIIKLLQ